ncbi:MAG: type III pantothenate kinase [bacterium]|nr:type III pantothenate kinase [bacterium]
MTTILCLDVGNTRIMAGVFSEDRMIAHWRLATKRDWTADEYGVIFRGLFAEEGLSPSDLQCSVLASVVPLLTPEIELMCHRGFGHRCLVVGPGVKTGLDIRYDDPREVGADRIAGAVAALEKYGGPVIVVDLGTALTVDVVSADGAYLGGAIAPGMGVAADALFSQAARLPRVDLIRPRSTIGKNTAASIQAGMLFGFAGLVDGLVTRMRRELGTEASVVATGDLAELLASESQAINCVEPLLVLEGLRLIFQRNQR